MSIRPHWLGVRRGRAGQSLFNLFALELAALRSEVHGVLDVPKITELCHPLLRHHLTQMRDRATSPASFRSSLRRIATLLAVEATRDLPVCSIEVLTPVAPCVGSQINCRIGLIPILRAGLGMTDAFLDLIPEAEVYHLGLYRNEQTAEPVEYYSKLPQEDPVDIAIVLDPMLATGGSATIALEMLQRWGVREVKLITVIAAREGIGAVAARFPELEVFVGAVDEELNMQKFIVPGLGDAGDRIFNTSTFCEKHVTFPNDE